MTTMQASEATAPETIYPEWQKVIREAQALEQAKQHRAADEAAVEEAARDQRLAELLGEALSLFGIDAKPITNRYQLDGIVFSLERVGNTLKHGAFYNFDLLLSYALESKYQEAAWDLFYGYLFSIPVHEHSNTQWNELQARMADGIDQVTRESIQFMHQCDERWRTQPVQQPAHEANLSTADQLVSLIRQLVSHEVASLYGQ